MALLEAPVCACCDGPYNIVDVFQKWGGVLFKGDEVLPICSSECYKNIGQRLGPGWVVTGNQAHPVEPLFNDSDSG